MFKILSMAMIAASMCLPSVAAAETYPNGPVRMIVGFPPGGSSDIAARVIAESMSKSLGQPVVVENKAGAGGNIAAAEVIRTKPDGYTVLYATSGIILGPLVNPAANYDAVTDFSPVAVTASNPLVFVVNKDVPAKTLAEFVDWAKTQDNLNFASTGAGTMTHLPAAAFIAEFDIKATHVPYRGASPAMVDLANGNAQFMISALSEARAMLEAGRIRALAMTTTERVPGYPDVPTMKEAVGTDNFVMGGWQALVVPRGVDPRIVEKLNTAVNDAVISEAVQKQFAPQGTQLVGGTIKEFTEFMRAERVRWKKIVEESGATAG